MSSSTKNQEPMTHAVIHVTRTITEHAFIRVAATTDQEAISRVQTHMKQKGDDFNWHSGRTDHLRYDLDVEEREDESGFEEEAA